MNNTHGPLIDGEATLAGDSATSVRNPANGEEIASVGRADAGDVDRAVRNAHAVETGVLSVNSSSSVHIEAPFGGVKQSGIGREHCMAALEHYSEYKSVFIADD